MARRGHGAGGGSRLAAGFERSLVPGLLIATVYYAVFGGEYSLFELRAARADVVEEQAALEQVHAQIDSLRAWADSLRSDPATIERVAREDFGMIRDGEILYRFVETPDDGEAATPTPER